MRTRLPPFAIVLAVVATACVAPGADVPENDGPAGLQEPTFAPLSEDDSSSPAATVRPSTSPTRTPSDPISPTAAASPEGPSSTTAPPDSPPAPTPAPIAPARGSLSDGTGDLSGLNRSRAPGYADLRAAALEMGAERGSIRVDFADAAPDQGAGDEILNVATYHDVTGDGRVDYEIWASLTADGWGTSWYDLRAGTARFAAEDDVEVAVESGTLVLSFPSSHLAGARSGQWLASSEWGTGLMMSTGTTVTDDAPDDRSGRRWPN